MHEAARYHRSGPPSVARHLPFWAATRGLRVGARLRRRALPPADARGPGTAPGAGDGPDGQRAAGVAMTVKAAS